MTLTEAYERRIEFYNHNHSPRDGRFTSGPGGARTANPAPGGKVWSGVSAHPKRRTKPTPGEFATEAVARRIYTADLGGGYRSVVTDIESRSDEGRNPKWANISVRGNITLNGRSRGYFERTLFHNPDGTISVEHELLVIDGDHKGHGLADRFNAHAVVEYQKMGVDRITLTAGDVEYSVGGYAWARQGFRLNGTPASNKAFLTKSLSRIDTQLLKPVYREHAAQIRKEIAALKKALEAGEDVQPIHIASIGEKYARHKTTDPNGFKYETWPGKDVLLGTSWKAVYYFDASKQLSAAATDLEHADLRPKFRYEWIDFTFNPNQPRDKDGKWTVSVQHVANKANAEAILKGGFSTGTPTWDRSFGEGVYFSEAGDAKSAKFYARQGGREWRSAQVIEGTVSLANPLHIEARTHSHFRAEVVKALGGADAVRDMAQAKYDHTVAVTKRIVAEELGPDHGVDLTHPESVFWVHYEDTPGIAPSVSQRVEDAAERIHERIKEETGGSPTENGSWRYLAEGIERIAKPGISTNSDNDHQYSELLGNLARDHGYDGIVINTNHWGGVGGQQVVVFDTSAIKVTGSRPYAQSRTASASAEEFYNKNHDPRDGRFSSGPGGVSAGPKVKEAYLSRTAGQGKPGTTEFGRRINAMLDGDRDLRYLSKASIDADHAKKVAGRLTVDEDELLRAYTVGLPNIVHSAPYRAEWWARENLEQYHAEKEAFAEMQSALKRIRDVRTEDHIAVNESERILQAALDQRIGQDDIYADTVVQGAFGTIVLKGVRQRNVAKSVVVDDVMEQAVIRVGHEISREIEARQLKEIDLDGMAATHTAAMSRIRAEVDAVYGEGTVQTRDISVAYYSGMNAAHVSVYAYGKPAEGGEGPRQKMLDNIRAIVIETGIRSSDMNTHQMSVARVVHERILGEVLSEITQLGGRLTGTPKQATNRQGKLSSHSQVVAAVSKYPESWINETSLGNPLRFRSTTGRAHYQHNAKDGKSEITLDGSIATAIHEFAHRMERTIPGVLDLEARFHDRRTAGEVETRLGAGYGRNEVGKSDQFFNKYAGKTYRGNAYELLSMGYEHMHSYRDWTIIDGEYRAFVLGTLVSAYRG